MGLTDDLNKLKNKVEKMCIELAISRSVNLKLTEENKYYDVELNNLNKLRFKKFIRSDNGFNNEHSKNAHINM